MRNEAKMKVYKLILSVAVLGIAQGALAEGQLCRRIRNAVLEDPSFKQMESKYTQLIQGKGMEKNFAASKESRRAILGLQSKINTTNKLLEKSVQEKDYASAAAHQKTIASLDSDLQKEMTRYKGIKTDLDGQASDRKMEALGVLPFKLVEHGDFDHIHLAAAQEEVRGADQIRVRNRVLYSCVRDFFETEKRAIFVTYQGEIVKAYADRGCEVKTLESLADSVAEQFGCDIRR